MNQEAEWNELETQSRRGRLSSEFIHRRRV